MLAVGIFCNHLTIHIEPCNVRGKSMYVGFQLFQFVDEANRIWFPNMVDFSLVVGGIKTTFTSTIPWSPSQSESPVQSPPLSQFLLWVVSLWLLWSMLLLLSCLPYLLHWAIVPVWGPPVRHSPSPQSSPGSAGSRQTLPVGRRRMPGLQYLAVHPAAACNTSSTCAVSPQVVLHKVLVHIAGSAQDTVAWPVTTWPEGNKVTN